MIKCLNGIIIYLCLKILYIYLCLIIFVFICIWIINNMFGLVFYIGVYIVLFIGGLFVF